MVKGIGFSLIKINAASFFTYQKEGEISNHHYLIM